MTRARKSPSGDNAGAERVLVIRTSKEARSLSTTVLGDRTAERKAQFYVGLDTLERFFLCRNDLTSA
jgi:hypothetical protein